MNRKINIILRVGAVLLCALPPGAVFSAPPPSVNRVIYEMEQVREEIDDLKTVVERITEDPATGKRTAVNISLTYKKPDKLISEVEGLSGRRVIISGDTMWIYSPEMEIAEKYLLKDSDQRRAAIYEMSWGLTSPIKALVRGMNRSVEVAENGILQIILVPDQKDAQIKKIVARVDPESWLIEEMAIQRTGQSPILLRVTEWNTNSGIPDEVFDFRVPEGVDVFEPIEGNPRGLY